MLFSCRRLVLAACGLLVFSGLPSCAIQEPVPPPRPERALWDWYDDGAAGEVTMLIELGRQRATFLRDGREIGWSYVTTGREGFSTRPGDYKILEKVIDKHSNLYGWVENEYGEIVRNPARHNVKLAPGERWVPAPMPYWMRLTWQGIGIHGGPIPRPGEPASHGCIRLPEEFVPYVYEQVAVGTRVRILP